MSKETILATHICWHARVLPKPRCHQLLRCHRSLIQFDATSRHIRAWFLSADHLWHLQRPNSSFQPGVVPSLSFQQSLQIYFDGADHQRQENLDVFCAGWRWKIWTRWKIKMGSGVAREWTSLVDEHFQGKHVLQSQKSTSVAETGRNIWFLQENSVFHQNKFFEH